MCVPAHHPGSDPHTSGHNSFNNTDHLAHLARNQPTGIKNNNEAIENISINYAWDDASIVHCTIFCYE